MVATNVQDVRAGVCNTQASYWNESTTCGCYASRVWRCLMRIAAWRWDLGFMSLLADDVEVAKNISPTCRTRTGLKLLSLLACALSAAGGFAWNFGALLPRLVEADCDRLFAAFDLSSRATLQRAFLSAVHCRFHVLRRRFSILRQLILLSLSSPSLLRSGRPMRAPSSGRTSLHLSRGPDAWRVPMRRQSRRLRSQLVERAWWTSTRVSSSRLR